MRQFLRSFSEVRKLIRRGPSSPDVIKICPVCLGKSLRIQPNPFLAFLSPSIYVCRKCGYKGSIIAEIERNEYQKLDRIIETNPQVGQDDEV